MDQLTITFITASAALIAGIATPIVSIIIARRQFKASVISNNRERWIEALRHAISEYIALVTSAALIARRKSSRWRDHLSRSINSKDGRTHGACEKQDPAHGQSQQTVHRALCKSIDAVHRVVVANQTKDGEKWRSNLDAITLAGHTVLEAEWANVKSGD